MLADMELWANIEIRVEGEVGADNTNCTHWLTLIYVGRVGEVGTESVGGWVRGRGEEDARCSSPTLASKILSSVRCGLVFGVELRQSQLFLHTD